MASTLPTETEVKGYLRSLSNWGRWGAEDQLGTINLITPAKRIAAAGLVRDGVSLTCARPIATDITADTTLQPLRFSGSSTRPTSRTWPGPAAIVGGGSSC